jgi:acyl-CoA hydrolase
MSYASLIATLKPGERVYIPGSAGEPIGLMEALCAEGAPPLHLTAPFVPGLNVAPLDSLPEGATFTSIFAHAQSPQVRERAMFRQLPLSFNGFVKHLSERVEFDAAIIQVSPPDAEGLCSAGVSGEFIPVAARRSRRLLGVVNARTPKLRNAPRFRLSDFAAVVQIDAALRQYDVGAPSPDATAIAGHIAPFIGDGATVEVGLGKIPDAVMRSLTGRRGLKLFSGMLSDGARDLVEAGALDPAFLHTACVYIGSEGFYRWLGGRDDFAAQGCDITHDIARLAGLKGFVAVNSAVSIDLFGQANLETLDGRMISGAGGGPDFSRAGVVGAGGISIIALPSTGGRKQSSRIVPSLDGLVSVPRHDIDVIATEHGAADLRGLTAAERMTRLIAIAAPQHREALERAGHDMIKRL